MNIWVKKSIELANSKGYLDRLFNIYPIELETVRKISDDIKNKIQYSFKAKNKIDLIKELLKLPKFPIDDPYIASLRRHPLLLSKNPETVERVGEKLLAMNLDELLKLSEKPKSSSRQLGHSFKKWLKNLKYPFLNENNFKKYSGIAFLEGSDENLKKFATTVLSVRNLKKGIDFILKIKSKFILGEAKFLTDYGGSQNNQFRDAISLIKINKNNVNVIGIAVIDGIVWFKSNAYMHKMVKSIHGIALSALLLKEFIKTQK